eukprot:4649078-Pyramimonas_sp.AAC.1
MRDVSLQVLRLEAARMRRTLHDCLFGFVQQGRTAADHLPHLAVMPDDRKIGVKIADWAVRRMKPPKRVIISMFYRN